MWNLLVAQARSNTLCFAGVPTMQTFDLNGNLLTKQIGGAYTTYTWDGENRLSSIAALRAPRSRREQSSRIFTMATA